MEAKDTEMTTLEINGLLTTGQFSGSTAYDGDCRLYDSPYHKIVVHQAEISFKAGIKEVVDAVKNTFPHGHVLLDEWQAKLKEWGIK